MRQFDVLIVGGGLAGSLTAAMLGRTGISTALVDPHDTYPPDFRCEKFDQSQLALLERTGLARELLAVTTPISRIAIARRGRLIEQLPSRQAGFDYERMVRAARNLLPASVERIPGTVGTLACGAKLQHAVLTGGEQVAARLVVLATGLNNRLRQSLGIKRCDVLAAFSTPVGFDLVPEAGSFSFEALTYNPERPRDDIAYLTLFPVGGRMRANLFTYRRPGDPFLAAIRREPEAALDTLMPRLRGVAGPYRTSGPIVVRPIDLHGVEGELQPGVVLVGDAFATSCPAAGTGANKVLTDVERLCHHHIPGWLATPGMGTEKIAAFYADPVKRASDASSFARAHRVRQAETDTGLAWRARRSVKQNPHLWRLAQAAQTVLGRVRGMRDGARPRVALRESRLP